jgi:acyl-coenzyme A thioesterase PaaI-like protein
MPRNIRRTINFYPPFVGAGIKVRRISADWREVDVEMKLHWWNKNYVGTHFGGSLYVMADPWYMVMLMNILGREYIVWDKAATIRFRRPGKGTVRAEFRLSEAQIEDVRAKVEAQKKYEPTFTVEVKDEAGEVVAEVEKLLYVRRK